MSESIRIPKRRGYTTIPNGLLPEGEISARSWGIYAYLLSRPPGWEVRARHLASVFTEGRDAIYTALKQLVSAGLMELETYRNEQGLPRKRYVLVDHDVLLSPSNPDSQDTANQDPGTQDTENPAGINTKLTRTEKVTTDKTHSASSVGGEPQALSKLGAAGFPQADPHGPPFGGEAPPF